MPPSFSLIFSSALKKLDWGLIIPVFFLSCIGLLALYSLGYENSFFYFKKQLFFVFFGLLAMVGLSFFDYRIFRNYPSFLIALYVSSLFLLLLVLIFGQKIRGTAGWISFRGLNFAPVEMAKLTIILLLAKYFSLRHIEMYRIRHLVVSFVYVGLPIFLVLLQPDLGSAFILLMIWLGMIIIAGVKLRHLVVILLIAAVCFGMMWATFLKDYQKKRVLTFFNPQKDPLGQSYNLRQSIIAIGSGGLWGRGLSESSQARLYFLPEPHTDFIFSAIAEGRGFAGVVLLFILFAAIIYRILKIGILSGNNFAKLFSLGVSLMFVCQIIINIGMNMGLLPIIGTPLPFLSYGGSSLLINFISLGLVQSIARRN